MVDFDFKTKADWNSGTKTDVVGDDDAPFIDVDKLAIAPIFFDPIASGSRKAGWTEDKSGTSTLVDTVGTPDYIKVTQQYSGRYAHIQRPPTAAMLPPNSDEIFAACYFKGVTDNNESKWNPCIGFYWDEDNWVRIRLDMSSNVMRAEQNVAGVVSSSGIFAISLNTWYEVYVHIAKVAGEYIYFAWARIPHGTWTLVGFAGPFPSWTADPTWIISGSGYTEKPTYPNTDFDNDTATVDVTKESHLSMFGIWPLATERGSWKSPSIDGHVALGKELHEIILEMDYGTADLYIDEVVIKRTSDDAVLSTWTGSIQGDTILYGSDFDNGFAVTDGVPFKIEVWLKSEDPMHWAELDRVAGNFSLVWLAQETMGMSDLAIAEVDALFEETMGMSDLAIAEVDALFEESLGMSDLAIAQFDALFEESLGFSDDVFVSSETLAGILGQVAPLLNITSFDFCEAVRESGQYITVNAVNAQAFLQRKQTRQSFDIELIIFPGDAVMYTCPDLTIEIDDIIVHDGLTYTVIGQHNRLHDGNILAVKSALQLDRDPPPKVEGLVGTGAAGSAAISWNDIDTIAYPMFDRYAVYQKIDAGDYKLLDETSANSITSANLPASTAKYKVLAISKADAEGELSDELTLTVT